MAMIRPREISRSVSAFAAKTPTLPPATHTNSYALGTRDVVLVEPATPYEDEQREWIAWARGLRSQGRTPVAIFATHHHVDHVGGIDALAKELALPVWAHEETRTRVDVPIARVLADGDAIDLDGPTPERWTALHTPGHAPGHVCLWNEESGDVIVGDMVATVGTILIAPGDGDMAVYIEQLERLARLDAKVALPAHGDPIDDPSALFRKYVAHRLMREEKVHAAVAAAGDRGATAAELVPIAYADTSPAAWPWALLSLRAHLDKLEHDGRVTARGERYAASR